MTSLANNPSFQHYNKIKEICQPLAKLGISYFSHVHIDKDNHFSVICNNPEFINLYYQKKYYNHDLHSSNINQMGRYIIWDHLPRTGKTLEMGKDAADLGILHTFSIIDRTRLGYDLFHFSTHIENEMMNQNYLTHLQLLKLFINYFKESASSLFLKNAYTEKTKIDKSHGGYLLQDASKLSLPEDQSQFLTQLSILKSSTKLTKRELDCFNLSLHGKTAKEIADILCLSRRTVEQHLGLAKKKLGLL